MAVVVKAYLQPSEGAEREIRRFTVDKDVAANHLYFSNRIVHAFKSLENVEFEMFWKDEEDDFICISSNEELEQALSERNEIFKVYINLKGHGNNNQRELPRHLGVVCDVCEADIQGTRFKCMTCRDYDLCQTCERRGRHAEHHMVRITDPGNPWRSGNPFAFGRHHGGFPGRGGCFGGPRQGTSCPPPPPPPPMGACPPFMAGWQQFFGGQPGNSDKSQEGAAEDKAGKQQPADGADFLRHMGEQVACMLDPFGIDVDVHVDHNGKFETVNTSKPKTEDTKEQSKNQPQDDVASEKTDSASARAEDAPSVPMDTQSETIETEASAATNVYPKLDDAMASTKPLPDRLTPDGDWTLLQPSGAPQPSNNTTEQPPQSANAQETPVLAPQTSSSVAHAVEQMKNMGFSDEEGWLTRLLIAKNGNISLVLDALQPHKK